MSKDVTLIDYGSGNLLSVQRALEQVGATVRIARDAASIATASRLLLPGVGAFADGMAGLRDAGVTDAILTHAASGRPLLGICLGMQMLATTSAEFGLHDGLGLIPGVVESIPAVAVNGAQHRVPNIGWNELAPPASRPWDTSMLAGTLPGTCVYLVHSYHLHPVDRAHLLAEYVYGGHRITAAVQRDNITGCQFHPEKSGQAGLKMLASFLDLPSA